MINLSEFLVILKPGIPSLTESVTWAARECQPKSEIRESVVKQYRYRYALNLLLELRNGTPFNAEDIYDLFTLTSTQNHTSTKLQSLYQNLSGNRAKFISDIEGLQTPLRAIFVKLWHAGEVLMPYL